MIGDEPWSFEKKWLVEAIILLELGRVHWLVRSCWERDKEERERENELDRNKGATQKQTPREAQKRRGDQLLLSLPGIGPWPRLMALASGI